MFKDVLDILFLINNVLFENFYINNIQYICIINNNIK